MIGLMSRRARSLIPPRKTSRTLPARDIKPHAATPLV
jgi:hypothetical protein